MFYTCFIYTQCIYFFWMVQMIVSSLCELITLEIQIQGGLQYVWRYQ